MHRPAKTGHHSHNRRIEVYVAVDGSVAPTVGAEWAGDTGHSPAHGSDDGRGDSKEREAMADAEMVYMTKQQRDDYLEGRKARLEREQDESRRAIQRLGEELRNLSARYVQALPGNELVRICSQLLTQAERYHSAESAAMSDDDLVGAP